ncbi:MAG: 4-hydroxy-3-methylbut-2-enyl diphosphate reductase [Synechococcales cyanobacterium RM1_1_8]|nr:4-hydroxy-3-methylbut-2-enyl diphosphate reductase [Synechococcales cyanobacterium RM1_1_8]
MDTKAFKRALNHSDRYTRNGFGQKEAVSGAMESAYQSNLIQEIRDHDYRLKRGKVTIRLAESFGFCWGVDRAVQIAYETRKHFPKEQLWITNEIIHNPSVNGHLRAMGVEFIPLENQVKNFSVVGEGDVVILPAFGASVQEMQLLDEKGCHIVDTTCPWVSKVWNSVEKHKRVNHTSIIHGKYKHEETVATSSFAEVYLVVLNLEEAQYVCDYILQDSGQGEGQEGDAGPSRAARREQFLTKFANAYSEGFDPDRDLDHIGVANQTTMLKGETEQIGKLFERTMMQKFGPANLNQHFLAFNTICDATQERQDAMFKLVEEPLDLLVVIGGYNSSNTTHLQEIAVERGLTSYHIDTEDCIGPGNRLSHLPLHGQTAVVIEPWLPEGEIRVGITSGASTPDKVVEAVIERIFAIQNAIQNAVQSREEAVSA